MLSYELSLPLSWKVKLLKIPSPLLLAGTEILASGILVCQTVHTNLHS